MDFVRPSYLQFYIHSARYVYRLCTTKTHKITTASQTTKFKPLKITVLPHMRISAHTHMRRPIHVWDIVLSYTRMGVQYEYTWLNDCVQLYSQQWTIPAWMHRLHACMPVICFPGVHVSRTHSYPYIIACFPIHQLPASHSDICILGKYVVSYIATCFL